MHETLDDAARILDESIAQPRPRYFAFIGSSGLPIGAIGDLLAHTYDINLAVDARAATVVEYQAVRWMAEFVGFPVASGTFTSGGTISNLTALAAARERAMPGSRHAGLGGERPVVYCSDEVHYSVTRAVELLGIGSDRLRVIPLDALRRVRADLLAEAIDRRSCRGRDAGRGGCDRRHDADRRGGPPRRGRRRMRTSRRVAARRRRVWPARGGPVRPELFAGFERADSCSVDAHKWLYLPKACGVVMSRHEDAFAASFAHEQGYLPHQQHELHAVGHHVGVLAAVPGAQGVARVPCARRAAVPRGDRRNLDEADLLYRHAQATEDFEVMEAPPQLSIVPFRHAPPGVAASTRTTSALADAIQADGRVYLASALIDGEVWLRPCFVNFRTTEDDV